MDYLKDYDWNNERRDFKPLLILGILTFGVLAAIITLPKLIDDNITDPNTSSLITQVVKDPDNYLGSSVTVRAEIENMIPGRSFTLDGPGVVNDKILVISKQPLEAVGGAGDTPLYKENDGVQVSGTVRKLNIQEVERELGIDLNENELRAWEGKPVIVANTVSPREEDSD